MTVAWIIGCGGLLGSALRRVLRQRGTALFCPRERFCWHDESAVLRQLETATDHFASAVAAADGWELYWAAGRGTMGSPAEALLAETRWFEALLALVSFRPELADKNGGLAFASSAGAIYAGSSDDVIDEYTPIAPTTPYAQAKLIQEQMAGEIASSRIPVLLARISTLYGSGQAQTKRQGLIAHMARSIVRNRPIHIYVPLDTMRDYIVADDAAADMVAALRLGGREQSCTIKIVAAEESKTIAQIAGAFRIASGRSPRIVTGASQLAGVYSRCIRFKSRIAPLHGKCPPNNLLVGVAATLAHEYAQYIRYGSEF